MWCSPSCERPSFLQFTIPDLALELVDQGLHTLVVLAILFGGVGELFDTALGLPQVLLGVGQTSVLGIHLGFELANAGLHLVHGLLAALEGVGLSVVPSP